MHMYFPKAVFLQFTILYIDSVVHIWFLKCYGLRYKKKILELASCTCVCDHLTRAINNYRVLCNAANNT